MTEPISISIRSGIMKVEGRLHLASGVEGIEQFITALETELLGCARQKGAIVIELPSPARASTEGDIPRTGLLSKKQVQKLLGISRSTLDKKVADGLIPQGGLDGGRRVWQAEAVWKLAEDMANNRAPSRETELCRKKTA